MIILFSCKSSVVDVIDIDLKNKVDYIKFSRIAKDVKYIDLELNKDCLIGSVNQFHRDDTLLFFLDKRRKSIFIFNDKGNYIAKVDDVGKGPGEYIAISSFCLDSENKSICVLDSPQNKFIKYDYYGNYISESYFSNSSIIRVVGFVDGKYICFTPDYVSNFRVGIWEANTKGEFIKEIRGVDSKYQYPGYPFPYYTTYKKDELSFYDSNTEEIFLLNIDGLTKSCQVNLKQKMPDEYHTKANVVNTDKGPVWGTKDYFRIKNLVECETSYLLTYQSRLREKIHAFCDKNNHEVIVSERFRNDIDNYPAGDQVFSYSNDEIMIIKFNDIDNPQLQILKTN